MCVNPHLIINAESDEAIYTNLLNRTFQEEYGYTPYDREENYAGYHSALVCKHDGRIIGGVSAYFSDPEKKEMLPMERRGIELRKYLDLKDKRYAEICRAGVLPAYRKYHIYSELMKRCLKFCGRTGCQAGFWVARKYHSKFYESELKRMGMTVRLLDVIQHTQHVKDREPQQIEYYLSCCLLQVNGVDGYSLTSYNPAFRP